ncbi:hypothetical protein F183_A14470 [Bryobacterales bacterium F-183]|nr:hypothetical protein F183_A14470 [Bryobacterales bacterium F-183]
MKNLVRIVTTAAVAAGLAAQAQQIPQATLDKIAEVGRLKATLLPEEQKMDSALLMRTLKAQGRLPAWLADITDAPAGAATVEIRGTVSDSLVQLIHDVGGTVQSYSVGSGLIQATIPSYEVARISQSADVRQISTNSGATTNSYSPGKVHPLIRMQDPLYQRWEARKLADVKNRKWNRDLPMLASNGLIPAIFSWFADATGIAAVGALTSQGYITHRANYVVNSLGYTGNGVKVGVLSDSASAARVAALIASGDLPANTVVLPGQEGPSTGSDEGTAMMEIISDMAPGAQLYFATAFTSVNSFAANIIALKDAGCTIIVDDVSYFSEGVFQDGPIAQAVNIVTAAGVTYLSSAGNSGNKTQGTSGTWQGDFVSAGAAGGVLTGGGLLHNWGGTVVNVLTLASGNPITLKWSDPLSGSANDYDLYILNSTATTIKRVSTGFQSGTQDPFEVVSGNGLVAGDLIVSLLWSGAPRALNLATNRSRISINTDSVVFGHNAAANTVSVAAVFWNAARRGTVPFIAGSAYKTESFSSDGPRRIFYQPNGTPITPGNVLIGTNGGQVLQKPDITAADGVSTKTPGFNPFYGTSAAAPSAAGIAALVKQVRPAYTPAQMKAALYANSLDIMGTGVDRDAGRGIAMADKAVAYALSH